MEWCSAAKKNGIMPFAATRRDLEIGILSEVRQRGRNSARHPLYVGSKKKWYKWAYLQKRKRHRLRKQTMVAWGRGGRCTEGIVREFRTVMYTQPYSKWIINKDLLYGSLLNVLWQPGWEGRIDTCICMAESLCCSPDTTTTLLIGYTPIQNKRFKIWKKILGMRPRLF